MSLSTSATSAELKLAAAHRAFMQSSLQHDFPRPDVQKPPPPWLLKFLEALMAAAPTLKIIFWVGVALVIALLLWVLLRDLPIAGRWRRKRAAVAEPADWRPEAGAARALLADADRLAQAGQFGDAIHLLLFRSIADIGAKRPDVTRLAFTSREILDAAPLSETGRAAFHTLAEAVELSFFGGRLAGDDDFARCRSQYEAFALAERRP